MGSDYIRLTTWCGQGQIKCIHIRSVEMQEGVCLFVFFFLCHFSKIYVLVCRYIKCRGFFGVKTEN